MVTVRGSIEFRDAVFALERRELLAYVRVAGSEGPVYLVMPSGLTGIRVIELGDLFGHSYPPVNMEDVAQALARARRDGETVPELEVLDLGEL